MGNFLTENRDGTPTCAENRDSHLTFFEQSKFISPIQDFPIEQAEVTLLGAL